MVIDYSKLIIDGYMSKNVTQLAPNFKLNANLNKREYDVDYAVFFTECKAVVQDWKEQITHELMAFFWDNKHKDYKSPCTVVVRSENGHIKVPMDMQDIEIIEQALEQAERELCENDTTQTDAQTGPEADDKSAQYSNKLRTEINDIYDFCVVTGVLNSDVISIVEFMTAVVSANFKHIYKHAEWQHSKAKCKYIIYILSGLIQNADWYVKTAHSIDTEPNRCSGANVIFEWKIEANRLKKRLNAQRKMY
jgi:hypothetical protein